MLEIQEMQIFPPAGQSSIRNIPKHPVRMSLWRPSHLLEARIPDSCVIPGFITHLSVHVGCSQTRMQEQVGTHKQTQEEA